jgi:hypothetical protein
MKNLSTEIIDAALNASAAEVGQTEPDKEIAEYLDRALALVVELLGLAPASSAGPAEREPR